jgi:hypothetical protein
MNSGKWTTIPVPSCWEQQVLVNAIMFAKDSLRKEKVCTNMLLMFLQPEE